MKKIFLSLSILFIFVISCYGQDVSLIKNSNITVSELNSEQLEKYNTLKKSEIFSEIWFVDIANLEEIQVNNRIKITVPDRNNPCASGVFAKVTSRPNNSENFYWYGEMNDVEQNSTECRVGRVTIIAENDAVFGHLTIEDESYSIQDIGGFTRVLCKVNKNYYKNKLCSMEDTEEQEFKNPNNAIIRTERAATCPIKVLTLFTSGALSRVPNINQTVTLAFALANQAYANSSILNTVELVQAANPVQVNFTETSNIASDVSTLATGNLLSTTGQTVNQLRNNFSADIVLLFGDGSGWGNIIGRAANFGPINAQAFAIFDALGSTGLGGLLFAHETGHLFGCRHEPCTALNASTACDATGPLQHAHTFKTGPFGNKKIRSTIMFSIADPTTAIPNFSNPNVSFDGEPTGTAARNNAQNIINTACTVAAFRPDLPPLQVSINGFNSACPCKAVNLSIPSYTGISSIQWQTSTTGNFTGYGNVVGTGSSYIANTPCTNGSKLFVKVTITGSGGQSFSAYHTLTAITTSQCPPASLINNNSNNNDFSCMPNPASNLTLVNFSTDKSAQSDLALFDANGRLAQKIIDNQLIEKGNHNLEFSTENLEQGIYYLHLTTKDAVKVQKLIIIK